MHNPAPMILTVLALALGALLPASAAKSTPDAAPKAAKVHGVNLKVRPAPKSVVAPKPRAAAETVPAETVYDYASCGCF